MGNYDSNPPIYYDSGIRYADLEVPLPNQNKIMAKIRRDWTKMSRADRLKVAQTVSTAINADPAYAGTTPTPAQFEALRAASDTAEKGIAGNATTLSQLRATGTTAADALLDGMFKVALSLEGILLGDPTGPSVDMTKPENFSLTAGDFDGRLDWHCDPVHMARGYHVQICYDMTATPAWEDLDDAPNSQSHTGSTASRDSPSNNSTTPSSARAGTPTTSPCSCRPPTRITTRARCRR